MSRYLSELKADIFLFRAIILVAVAFVSYVVVFFRDSDMRCAVCDAPLDLVGSKVPPFQQHAEAEPKKGVCGRVFSVLVHLFLSAGAEPFLMVTS